MTRSPLTFSLGLTGFLLGIPLANAQEVTQDIPAQPPPTQSQISRPAAAIATAPAPASLSAVQWSRNTADWQLQLQLSPGATITQTQQQSGNATAIDLHNVRFTGQALTGQALIEKTWRQENPTAQIAAIAIHQFDADTVRITVQGKAIAPTVEVTATQPQLQLRIAPVQLTAQALQAQRPASQNQGTPRQTVPPPSPGAIRIIVTGDRLTYRLSESSVGTRTNTDILDVPQSIQVIPEQVLEDQGSQTLADSTRNSAGISTGRVSSDSIATQLVVRGFPTDSILRNGLRDGTQRFGSGLNNVERVEILRGPASVLYGFGDLGGTVNIVTKQPSDRPSYSLEYTQGPFTNYNPSLDFSAPFSPDSPLGYRLSASYISAGSFRAFEENETWFVSPAVRLIDTESTTLTADLEYLKLVSNGGAPELPSVGTVVNNPNGDVDLAGNLGEPSLSEGEVRVTRLGYQLEHRFSPNWRLRNEFLLARADYSENTFILPISLEADQRTLRRGLAQNPSSVESYTLNTNAIGTFNTGDIEHQLLLGIELAKEVLEDEILVTRLDSIDIFDPVYRPDSRTSSVVFLDEKNRTETSAIAFYLQDQITFSDQLILVLGGRFDLVNQRYEDFRNPQFNFEQDANAFSPRVGIVFKPEENLSIYASYTESFKPLNFRETSRSLTGNEQVVGDPYKPERGRQFEIGAKADLLDDRLSATLALYQLTRTNVDSFSGTDTLVRRQVGEQRSQGVELSLTGELAPGWNLIASYAYTDAVITDDSRFEIGDRLPNVAEHAASIWTTYEIQRGRLQGLGFGVGVFYQGERQGDLENSFTLPAYLRTDASLFYRRDRLRVAVNFRNLFDVEYYEGARSNVRVIPGAPFALSGTISWEF